MSDIHAHDLHQMIRTWLLAEDPYGMNQMPRTEPTLDTNPRSGRAKAAGEGAVDAAIGRNPKAKAAGTKAVGAELAPSTVPPDAYPEAGRNALVPDRASSWGQDAVAKATAPQPLDMSGAPGWQSPEEASAWASALGQSAVGSAVNANTNRPTSVVRGPSAGQLTPEQEAQVQEMMRRSMADVPEGDEFVHDTSAVDEFLAGQNRPQGMGGFPPPSPSTEPPTGEAIKSRAKKRLKDPEDPDARQPE